VNRLALATISAGIFLACAANLNAAEADGSDAPGTADVVASGSPDATVSSKAYSRRVYETDDVGMIIGGASEDSKAKVLRLPVQK